METIADIPSPSEVGKVGYKNPPVEHRFKKGETRNPGGKPVGSRNRLQGDFLKQMADDFALHGKSAIVEMRETKPAEYIRAIASLMPKELEITRPMEDIDDDELNAAITAVRAVIAAQAVGEGTGHPAQPEQVAGV